MSDVKEFVKEQMAESYDWITDKFMDILADRIKHLDEQVAYERAITWGAMELIDKLDEKLAEYEKELKEQKVYDENAYDDAVSTIDKLVKQLENHAVYVPEVFKVRMELTHDQVADFTLYARSQGFTVLNYHSIEGPTNFFGKAAYGSDRDPNREVVFYILPDELWLDTILTVLDGGAI